MPRKITSLLLFAVLAACCTRSSKEVPEPAYHPHLLKPAAYYPSQGKKIDMDSVAEPVYVPAKGRFVQAGEASFTPEPSNYLPAGKPAYVPAKGKIINMDSVAPPRFFPIEGKKIRAGWPRWNAVPMVYSGNSPFSSIGVEQGLYSPFVKYMVEDRFGRVWMGHHGGTLGVWDGKGYMHYTREEGLMLYSGVFSILEDRKGKMWIAGNKLSVWDGIAFTDYGSLTGAPVHSMCEDRSGRIWIGTAEGLACWKDNGFFLYTRNQGLSDNEVTDVLEDRFGRIWMGTGHGVNIWNGEKFIHFTDVEGLIHNEVRCLLEDQTGRIWIGTANGLSIWDGKGFLEYTLSEGMTGNEVRRMVKDEAGRIWIETEGGISVWDGQRFRTYTVSEGLSGTGPYSFLEDRAGRIWIGTDGGGVSIFGWKNFSHRSIAEGLSDNFVSSVLEDRNGRIWIGTRGAGVNIWDGAGYTSYTQAEGLSDNHVHCMVEDDEGRIWIGTEKGGVSVWNGEGFIHYTTAEGLSSNRIWSIFKDRKGQVWIGSSGGGLNVWDGDGFKQYTHAEGLTGNNIFCFLEDRHNQIWMGTYDGVSVWDGEGFTHYTRDEGLGDNRVWSLLEDQYGHIWVGTNGGGINVWDGAGFYHYNESVGLSQNIGRSLSRDENGNIWVGTFNGLNLLRPTTDEQEWTLRKYFQPDGLTGVSINTMLLDSRDCLWLGTSKGLSRMNLDQQQPDTSRPMLFLRDLQPFFEFVDWRQIQDSLQKGVDPVTGEQQLSLAGTTFDSVAAFTNLPRNPVFPHHINDLTFHWSGTHSVAPHKLLYSYFLEGNDSDWSPPLPDNQVRFQNLSPGEYTFKLRAAGINGRWSDTVAYSFRIRPPWWATPSAYLTYALLLLGLVYSIYRFQLNRRLAEAEARRLRELDTFKSNLYTNITHEFRTPLTVIMGMAGEIRGHERIKELIIRNGRDLLQLVNQMLDLRKLEVGALQLDLIQGNIIPFLKYLIESFHSTAATKGITLSFQNDVDFLVMDYDPERLRQVVMNLLSNAVKFTPKGGAVGMKIEPDEPNATVLIRIKDTGSGIPGDQLPFIFDRFYQADASATRRAEGTGIGLALVKELVEAMGGRISVESEKGRGSIFLLSLPISRKASVIDSNELEEEVVKTAESAAPAAAAGKTPKALPFNWHPFITPESSTLPLALIVEDNEDVADYLKLCMEGEYQIHWAQNGREGLDKALEIVPDIIISDVMMPEMDGFELCRTLKSDERSSHIPIILLTARATQEDRLEGLERGADAYLVKPFDKAELEIRLRQLLDLRRRLREKYSNASPETVDAKRENDPELLFLKKLHSVVLEHLSDEDFKVEPDLCRAMTMSRPQLYRKLKALKGISPSEYLRTMRMHKARQLLLESALSIGEVADRVGFKDPSYFTRVYTATFGEAPSRTGK